MAKRKKYGEVLDEDDVSEGEKAEIANGGEQIPLGISARQLALSQARAAQAGRPLKMKDQLQRASAQKLSSSKTAPIKPALKEKAGTVKKQVGGLRAVGSQLAAETADAVGGQKNLYPTRSSVYDASDD